MRFTADHAQLAPAISLLSRVVPSRAVRPILSSILLEAADGHLTLSATDLQTTAVTTVAAAVAEEGRTAVPCRYLSEVLRRIPGGELTWTDQAADSGLRVQWGRSEFSLHGFDPDDFPPVPSFPDQPGHSLPQGLVRHAFLHSAFAAAEGDTGRALLTGVELRLLPTGLFALATNGFQVASYSSDRALQRPEEGAVTVPAHILSELARVLGDSEEPCDISQQGNQLLVRAGSTYYATRLLEGRYFAVLDLVPKEFSTVVSTDRQGFVEACERVAIVCEGEAPYALTLDVRGEGLKLIADSADVGHAEETVDARVSGPALHVGFNARQLIQGLRQFSGREVCLEFSGEKTLVRCGDPSDPRLQYLQMPLQMPS